jgi:hypothetical protein
MGVSQSVALANGTGRAAVEAAGIKLTRAPLRINLNRQYALKEYLEVHGGHGPNANYKVSNEKKKKKQKKKKKFRNILTHSGELQQILGGLGVAFALTSVWTVFQKSVFNHDIPSTITPAHQAAAAQRANEQQHYALTKHKIGKKVEAHIMSAEAAKQEVAAEVEKLK